MNHMAPRVFIEGLQHSLILTHLNSNFATIREPVNLPGTDQYPAGEEVMSEVIKTRMSVQVFVRYFYQIFIFHQMIALQEL